MNKEAVAWLEDRPIGPNAAEDTYEEAGDWAPVYFTELYSFKDDHPSEDTCGRCRIARALGGLTVI